MTTPDIKTPLPGPKAKALIDRDRRFVTTSYTRDYPFVMAHGDGAVVEDVDGNRFIDCAAGIAVSSTGHSHPEVVNAIIDQAQRFVHMSGTDFFYEPQIRLAEEMADVVPIDGPVRSFFGNSATEAIEAAIKLARYHTKRHGLIAFLGAFHGRSMGSLSLTASKTLHRRGFGPMMPGVYHAPFAECYRCPVNLKPESCQAECAGYIEDQIFMHLVSPDEVAAIVLEPIQGEGGYIVPPQQFIDRLKAIAKPHGQIHSGIQENGRRGGTENVPGIVGLGTAAELAQKELAAKAGRLKTLRDRLVADVTGEIPYAIFTGHPQERLPGHASFCFEGIEGEALVFLLNARGICANTGSACASKALKVSPVLCAIGLPTEVAQGSPVFTLSPSDPCSGESVLFSLVANDTAMLATATAIAAISALSVAAPTIMPTISGIACGI